MSKRSKPRKSNSKNPTWKPLISPFKDFTTEQRMEFIKYIGETSESMYENELRSLQAVLDRVDPVLLLSSFSFYALHSDGIRPESESLATQHHAELLQALLLRKTAERQEFQPIVGNILEEITNMITKISFSYANKRLLSVKEGMSEQEERRLGIVESMRMHTQIVRNWGYPSQIQRTVINLFKPFDEITEKTTGLRIEHLVNMIFKIINLLSDRLNTHIQKVASFLRPNTVNKMIEQYSEVFLPHEKRKDEAAKLLKLVKDKRLSKDALKFILISHCDLFLPDIFELSLEDFVSCYESNIEPSLLKQLLDQWSLQFGELVNNKIDHLFMANPIWFKPLIKFQENKYFLPIGGLLVTFCLELMEMVIKDHSAIWQRYETRRGDFLELAVEKLFRDNFPKSEIFVGSQWVDPIDPAKVYENDLIVIVDSTAIVIEAKSGKVRAASRRGADKTLQDDLQKLIADASLQARRFIDFVKSNPVHDFTTSKNRINKIDASRVKAFIPLNITLEHLGKLGSHTPSLKAAGIITEDNLIPSLSLPDVESIFEILSPISQKLHYLLWRSKLEASTEYNADEIDLLAIYVKDSFSEAQYFANQKMFLELYGESELFNPYFMREHHLRNVSKPERKLSQWWKDILYRVEQRSVSGWTELSYILLEFPYKEQMEMEKRYKRLKPELKKKRGEELLYTSLSTNEVSIIICSYKNLDRSTRNELMGRVTQTTMDEFSTKQSVIIALDIDRETLDYPYSVIALCHPNQSEQADKP